MKKRKVYLALLVALILLAGCAKRQQEADYASERMEDGGAYYMYKVKNTYARPTYVNDMSAVTSAEMEDGNLQNEYDRIKKVIVNTEIMMETYEMEKTMETIMNSLSAAGGYVQSSQEGKRNYGEKAYRRYANMVLRVPADRYDEFMASSKEAGNIISQSTDSNDITESYYNLEAQIESLKLEEERVKQFYARAKDIDELLRIEQRLTEIQKELAKYESTLKNYKLLTDYCTVTINIDEVTVFTETDDTFFARLTRKVTDSARTFVRFLENSLFFLIDSIWYVVLLAAVIFGLRKLNDRFDFTGRITRSREERKQRKLEARKLKETM